MGSTNSAQSASGQNKNKDYKKQRKICHSLSKLEFYQHFKSFLDHEVIRIFAFEIRQENTVGSTLDLLHCFLQIKLEDGSWILTDLCQRQDSDFIILKFEEVFEFNYNCCLGPGTGSLKKQNLKFREIIDYAVEFSNVKSKEYNLMNNNCYHYADYICRQFCEDNPKIILEQLDLQKVRAGTGFIGVGVRKLLNKSEVQTLKRADIQFRKPKKSRRRTSKINKQNDLQSRRIAKQSNFVSDQTTTDSGSKQLNENSEITLQSDIYMDPSGRFSKNTKQSTSSLGNQRNEDSVRQSFKSSCYMQNNNDQYLLTHSVIKEDEDEKQTDSIFIYGTENSNKNIESSNNIDNPMRQKQKQLFQQSIQQSSISNISGRNRVKKDKISSQNDIQDSQCSQVITHEIQIDDDYCGANLKRQKNNKQQSDFLTNLNDTPFYGTQF